MQVFFPHSHMFNYYTSYGAVLDKLASSVVDFVHVLNKLYNTVAVAIFVVIPVHKEADHTKII